MQVGSAWPSLPLRTHALWLAVGTLLPVMLFAGAIAYTLAQRERATFERGLRERVLAISTAVDAELRVSIAALETLATAPSLAADDLATFHERMQRANAARTDWLTVNLALPSGAQVLNALRPPGSELPAIPERKSFDQLLASARPVVSDIVLGPVTHQHDFGVRVPVMRDGALRYVLTAVVDPDTIWRLLESQQLPREWVGGIVDRNRRFVARTRASRESVGQPTSRTLDAALAGGAAEGAFEGTTLEGVQSYTAFQRSPLSGWSVAIAVPASTVEAAARRALLLGGLGAAFALAVALLLARLIGRRITHPVDALAAQARALAEGRLLPEAAEQKMTVSEFQDLQLVLHDAVRAVQARDALQHQLAAVTGNATRALFMLDGQQRCSFMNPAAERMTGWTLAEAQGRALHEVLRPAQLDAPSPADPPWAADRTTPAEASQRGEAQFTHRDGHSYPVAYTASPICEQGRAVGTVIEVRDIGEERRKEAERLTLLEREREARTEAEAANRAKDEFLAMLGHELRNPLGAISNAALVLDARRDGDTAERARGVMRRQIAHLTRLVDDLLDASRVSTGKIMLARRPLELAALVRRSAQALLEARHHEVSLDLVPVWIDGDETRVEQIVSNLLSNAVRYTPDGGRIALALRREGATAVLTVRDSGIGIAPELLPRIFGLFVQGDRGIERTQGGLGIGLTLALRLARLHGGSLEAASEGADRGSCFTLRMPAIEAPGEAAHAGLRGAAGSVPRRVLLVEDNDDAREMLCATLEQAGHAVTDRADGSTGLAAALALRPEVALIDLGLPGLSGHEVAQRIRAHPAGREMFLVAITGYGRPSDRVRSAAAGFDLHLVKPVDIEQLLQALATVGSGASHAAP